MRGRPARLSLLHKLPIATNPPVVLKISRPPDTDARPSRTPDNGGCPLLVFSRLFSERLMTPPAVNMHMPQHPARHHAPAAARSAARTAQFQPAARARRFFCFFLKAARLRAVFLRFFSRIGH